MMNTRTSTLAQRTLTVTAAAFLALSLSGCAVLQGVINANSKPVRDAETLEVTDSGEADVFSIKVGDCTNEELGETVTSVQMVPCSEPHDEEAYFEGTLTGDSFPGDEQVEISADEICYNQFESFVGKSYEDSVLDYYPYLPTEQSWTEINDRIVTCMIYDPSARITGSLAGSAR